MTEKYTNEYCKQDNEYETEKASVWLRFFAKSIDLINVNIILCFIIFILFYFFNLSLTPLLSNEKFISFIESSQLSSILITVPYSLILSIFYILFDSYIVYLTGNSIGKKILRIKVLNSDNRNLNYYDLVKRNSLLTFYGLALNILILSSFSKFLCYAKYKETRKIIWDTKTNTIVISYGIKKLKAFIFVILYYILAIFVAASLLLSAVYVFSEKDSRPETLHLLESNNFFLESSPPYKTPNNEHNTKSLMSIFVFSEKAVVSYKLQKKDGSVIDPSDNQYINPLIESYKNYSLKRYCIGEFKYFRDRNISVEEIYKNYTNDKLFSYEFTNKSCDK